MKKTIYILIGAAAMVLCSCHGKTQQNPNDLDSTEEMVLSDSVIAQLDSIGETLCQIADTCQLGEIFTQEKINLSKEQQQIKPDYLLTQKDINDLMTLNQKYVAMAYLAIDNSVQQLYYGDDDDYYDNAMSRLAADTEETNRKAAEKAKGQALTLDNARQFYNDMKERNRLDKFYLAEAAYMVEAMYIVSNNMEIYMPVIDDQTASAMSRRLSTARAGIQLITSQHPDMQPVLAAVNLLSEIRAANAAQLQQQIVLSRDKLQRARAELLRQ